MKAPRAALDAALAAALAAAVWTVLFDMTPVANSCWAFSKLAPVVRYSACTCRGRQRRGSRGLKCAVLRIVIVPYTVGNEYRIISNNVNIFY